MTGMTNESTKCNVTALLLYEYYIFFDLLVLWEKYNVKEKYDSSL